jgi:hypothetical protein
MTSQTPEDAANKPTQLFFPVMSTILFIGLAVYELPAFYGWIYLAVALFGMTTVYLSWQGNKRKKLAQRTPADPKGPMPGDKPQAGQKE